LSNPLFRQVIIELVQAHKTWSLAGFCLTPRNERGRHQFGTLGAKSILVPEKELGSYVSS
jgi:hypothetical protein